MSSQPARLAKDRRAREAIHAVHSVVAGSGILKVITYWIVQAKGVIESGIVQLSPASLQGVTFTTASACLFSVVRHS